MSMNCEYRAMLLVVARQIGTKELEELKFLCVDMIPESRREEITETLRLFLELEKQARLGIDQLDWLGYMLDKIGRQDLVLKLRDFQFQRNAFLGHLRKRTITDSATLQENHATENSEYSTIPNNYPPSSEYNPSNNRQAGEVTARCILRIASVGAWFGGCAYLLNQYKDDPEALINVITRVILPSGIVVRHIASGSVKLLLWATDLSALKELWNRYKTGQLREDLENLLVTEDLKNLANGEKIEFSVEMSEDEYRNACLDLVIAHYEATSYLNTSLSRTLHRSCSLTDMTSLNIQPIMENARIQELPRDTKYKIPIQNKHLLKLQLSECSSMSSGRFSSSVCSESSESTDDSHFLLCDFLQTSDKVQDICALLDRDMILCDDWRSLASEFGNKMINIRLWERKPSPSLALLEDIVFKSPYTKVTELIDKLSELDRDDVVAQIQGREYNSDPLSLWNLPFMVRKKIAVELDSATQSQFTDVVRNLADNISPGEIESLRKRPSPTMTLLEELETAFPSLHVSHLRDACLQGKVTDAVKTLERYTRMTQLKRKRV